MIAYQISVSAAGVSDWLRLDTRGFPLNIYTLSVEMTNELGAVVTVEFTIDRDIDDDPHAIAHNVLCELTESTSSHMQGPMAAIRLNVEDYKSGTITLRVLQA